MASPVLILTGPPGTGTPDAIVAEITARRSGGAFAVGDRS
jgi:hypothetical protein